MVADAARLLPAPETVEDGVEPLAEVVGAELTLAERTDVPEPPLAALDPANPRPVPGEDELPVPEVELQVVPFRPALAARAHLLVVLHVRGVFGTEGPRAVLADVGPGVRAAEEPAAELAAWSRAGATIRAAEGHADMLPIPG